MRGGAPNSSFWRYVTIQAPCYYISYVTSALSVIQLRKVANPRSLEVATDAYLKLFTYTDKDPEMTAEEVPMYAGLK